MTHELVKSVLEAAGTNKDHLIRLLVFIEGDMICSYEHTEALLRNVGRFLGLFHQTLKVSG